MENDTPAKKGPVGINGSTRFKRHVAHPEEEISLYCDVISPQKAIILMAARMEKRSKLPLLKSIAPSFIGSILLNMGYLIAMKLKADPNMQDAYAQFIFPIGFVTAMQCNQEICVGLVLLSVFGILHQQVPWYRCLWAFLFSTFCNVLGALFLSGYFYVKEPYIEWASERKLSLVDTIINSARSRMRGGEDGNVHEWFAVLLQATFTMWFVSVSGFLFFMSTTRKAKIAMTWMPIVVFPSLGGQHCIVNTTACFSGYIFVQMGLGTPYAGGKDYLTIRNIFYWNLIPTFLGNVLGSIWTGLHFYLMFKPPHTDLSRPEAIKKADWAQDDAWQQKGEPSPFPRMPPPSTEEADGEQQRVCADGGQRVNFLSHV